MGEVSSINQDFSSPNLWLLEDDDRGLCHVTALSSSPRRPAAVEKDLSGLAAVVGAALLRLLLLLLLLLLRVLPPFLYPELPPVRRPRRPL